MIPRLIPLLFVLNPKEGQRDSRELLYGIAYCTYISRVLWDVTEDGRELLDSFQVGND